MTGYCDCAKGCLKSVSRDVGKVLLRDNRDLTESEFQSALDVCARIKHFVDNREPYIAAHGLDRAFCLPDGLWSGKAFNDYLNTFREVSGGHYEVINHLRLFMSFFSGYSLRRLSGVPGKPSFEAVTSDLDEEIAKLLEKPDEWVNRWYRLTAGLPKNLVYSPPRMLGEIGWDVDGVVVNHDSCVYQERINLMHDAGIFEWLQRRVENGAAIRILEIGAGHGALAYQIKKILPACDYWICDLPESLLFSGIYLTVTRPDSKAGFGDEAPNGFTLMPNHMIDRITGKFDLAINALSFSEMSEHQLRVYAKKLSLVLEDGILFEQNQDNRHLGLLSAEEILREYFPIQRALNGGLTWRATQGIPNLWATEARNLPPAENNLKRTLRTAARESTWLLRRARQIVSK